MSLSASGWSWQHTLARDSGVLSENKDNFARLIVVLLGTHRVHGLLSPPGSSSVISKVSVRFPKSHEEPHELSLEVCDEPEEPRTPSSSTTLLSLPSSVLPFFSPRNSGSPGDPAAPLPDSLLPVSSSAVCRPLSLLPVVLTDQPAPLPRLERLALSKAVGKTVLQPAFDPEVSEYRAALPEAQSVTVVAEAAPGFFVKLQESEDSLFFGHSPAPPGKHHPLADSVKENRTSGFYRLTCREAGSAHHVNVVVYSPTAASPDTCSTPSKCEELRSGESLPAVFKPVTYKVHIHCVAPRTGRAVLAGINAQTGTLQPAVFSPQNHLYYLKLPEDVDRDTVTFTAANSHTEIVVGEEGKRHVGQARNVQVWLSSNDASKVIPVKTYAKAQGEEDSEEGELYFLVLIRAYPAAAQPRGGEKQLAEFDTEPLLKNLDVVGSTLKPPFDPAMWVFRTHRLDIVHMHAGCDSDLVARQAPPSPLENLPVTTYCQVEGVFLHSHAEEAVTTGLCRQRSWSPRPHMR